MHKKPLVAALAALSLTGASFAAHAAQQQQAPEQARHTSVHASASALQRALDGNSTAGYVPKTFINNSGLWLAGYGQMTAAYNSNAIGRSASPLPDMPTSGSSFTFGLPAVSVMLGYTSDNVGMFVSGIYQNVPSVASTTTSISMASAESVDEAYLTYSINDMFAVKAGQFHSDFGSYDPTAALQSVTTIASFSNVTGIEGVFAANGFHGSVTGAMVNGATGTASSGVTNDARPNTVIVNGGYDMPLAGGTAGVQGSYTNVLPQLLTNNTSKSAAWTVGGHFANEAFVVKADVLNTRYKRTDNKTPYVFDGSVDYKLGNKFGHDMVVGGYGAYITKSDASAAEFSDTHWLLGAKFGYVVNQYVDATAYLQHAAVQTSGLKNNDTAMLAVTVKV
jgi:hypothetical protein